MTYLYPSGIKSRNEDARTAPWRRAEKVLCEEFNLTEEHASSHDARDQNGRKVELKSCVDYRKNGRVGQFEIWSRQFYDLQVYDKIGFLVHSPKNGHPVIATRLVAVGDIRDRGKFVRYRHPTMGYRSRRLIEWPEIIPLEDVGFFSRRRYLDHYDQEEIEETILPAPVTPQSEEGATE